MYDTWSQILYLSLGNQMSGIHEDGWWPQALQLTEEESHGMGFQAGLKSQELDIMQSTVGCLLFHSTVSQKRHRQDHISNKTSICPEPVFG